MEIFLATLFVVVCALLIVVVLLQKGRGGGLGAAFGGAGGGAFGTKVGDVFTWVTIVLTALFLVLAITTSLFFRQEPDTVAEPMFTPPAGAVIDSTSVAISVSRTRGKNVAIHYTTDESDPTEESERYRNSPVIVQPGTTLKAIAFQQGKQPSPIAVGYYGALEEATQPAPAAEPN